jgi:hypothetical protein
MALNPNILGFDPILLTHGTSRVLLTEAKSYLSVQTDGGCTVTVTRADKPDGTALGAPASTFTVAPGTFKTQAVDWQVYSIAAAGGAARVCLG